MAVDRSTWDHGPWDTEPDEVRWTDELTGYDCVILRHKSFGNLNGYVGVPREHPTTGLHYDDFTIDVHGGLTFSGNMPGLNGNLFWYGFDTLHAGDKGPGLDAVLRLAGTAPPEVFDMHANYRDMAYVRAEVESLARQLKALERLRVDLNVRKPVVEDTGSG